MAARKQDLQAELRAIRREIERVRQQRDAVPQTLVPKDQALDRADRYIDDLARTGAVDVVAFTAPGHGGARLIRDTATDGTTGIARVSLEPVARLLAWLDPDRLRAALHTEIKRTYADGPDTLSPADRLALDRTLAARQLELETREEQLIRAAEAEGLAITRRPDADPRALISE